MKRKPNPEETKTRTLMDYALVALAQLGGRATRDQIVDRVGELIKDHLTPADLVPVHWGPDGKSAYVPEGYTGETWPVWANKSKQAIVNAIREKLVISDAGACIFSPDGLRHVGMLAARGLKQ